MSLVANIYRSTDAGAPALTGLATSLVTLLDAVLVNGYGVEGSMKAPLGWTLELVDTGKRAYRNSVELGTGFYLQINDAGTIGDARQACVRGYSSMTAFDAGIDPTPTTTQAANGSIVAKSNALSGDAREWVIVGNARSFYLFVNPFSSGSTNMRHVYFFGDYRSIRDSEPLGWLISTTGNTSFNGSGDVTNYFLAGGGSFATAGTAELYLPRSYTDISGAVSGYVYGTGSSATYYAWASGQSGLSNINKVYPHPVTGGLYYVLGQVFESGIFLRGVMPGLIVPLHNKPLSDAQSLAAPSEFPIGSKLVAINYAAEIWSSLSNTQYIGQLIFNIEAEWGY